jgi:hypothetical protein
MKTSMTLLAALSLALALGCEKKDETEKPAGEPVVAPKPATPTEVSPQPSTMAPTGDLIGVQACDDYIAKYSKCLDTKVPAEQKAQLQTSFDNLKQGWKTAAATPEGKTALASTCQQAIDTAKQSTAAFGCEM